MILEYMVAQKVPSLPQILDLLLTELYNLVIHIFDIAKIIMKY